MNPTQKWILPAYLITVPQVMPAGSDEETSEGEEENGDFTKKQFKRPPFEIDWTKPGKVTTEDELPVENRSPYESQFITKVECESFGPDSNEIEERVAVVIGHVNSSGTHLLFNLIQNSR